MQDHISRTGGKDDTFLELVRIEQIPDNKHVYEIFNSFVNDKNTKVKDGIIYYVWSSVNAQTGIVDSLHQYEKDKIIREFTLRKSN